MKTQNNSTGRKTIEIKELFLETSERLSGYTQLVAKDENGDEWIIEGQYCGGIPMSGWGKIKTLSTEKQQ